VGGFGHRGVKSGDMHQQGSVAGSTPCHPSVRKGPALPSKPFIGYQAGLWQVTLAHAKVQGAMGRQHICDYIGKTGKISTLYSGTTQCTYI
jgi:hypothetical protein